MPAIGAVCSLYVSRLPACLLLRAVLAIAPNDEDGLHCKLIAHMQLGDFDQAMVLVSKPALAARGLAFERVRSTTHVQSALDSFLAHCQ